MNTFAIGPGLLLILLGLGGFSGLPLSLPPLPPDPLVERAAPAECLLHVALAGQAKAAAGAANRVEALLAEADVQRFIGEVDSMVAKMLARQDAAADDGGPRFTPAMRSLAFMLLTRPAALTIDSLAIGPNGVTAEASLLVNCGPDVDRFRAALDATIAQLSRTEAWLTLEEFDVQGLKATRLAGLPPEAPVMAWGFKDGSFMAAVGTDALEHLLVRLADKARPAPAWKTALEKHVLEPLGDTWTACALPGEGPMGLPRTAVSVGLDDAKTFTKTLAAVTALVTKGAAQPGMPQLKLGSRKAHAGEQQVFTARLGDSPLEPAWCVDGDRGVGGGRRGDDRPAGGPAVARRRGGDQGVAR